MIVHALDLKTYVVEIDVSLLKRFEKGRFFQHKLVVIYIKDMHAG